MDLDLLFDRFAPVEIRERSLPHWRQDGKLYFVTWRQEDSIAQVKREQLIRERKAFIEMYGDPATTRLSSNASREYYRLFSDRVQRWLDAGDGSCVLRELRPRLIVRDAVHHFEGKRYRLGSFAIAGNHVHALVLPLAGIDLSKILHSWKSFTANKINKALDRRGPLWAVESYDHLVRSTESLDRIQTYIHAHEEQGAYVERRQF